MMTARQSPIMSYPYTGSSYPLRYIPVSTDLGNRYGNTMSTSSTLGTGLTSTGASGYSGDRRWTRESGTTSNLATKLGELEIHGSRENSNLPITDPSRNFSSSFYSSSNHEQDKLVNDMFTSKRSPAPSPSPSNLRQEEGDKPEPVDPRSSLRKLLDCVKDLQDLDVEKCLRDYKIIKEASDPMGLTKEWREVLEKKEAEALEKETNFQEQIDDLKRQLKSKEAYIEEIRKALSELRVEKDQVEKEKTEALTRLSKEMSSKLNDKNPNITDLSDSNRPTKIAEKYNELYDNEWTDALEELTEERYLEEVAISELLACVQAAYSFCQKAASNQIENLRRALTNPEFERETSFKGLYKTAIPLFTVKCLELCWLMNMHNPSVALGLPPAKDSPFDGTFYKEYTRTGTTVDFVVWLPLLLHESGPLLQKGVLQPKQSMARLVIFMLGVKQHKHHLSMGQAKREEQTSICMGTHISQPSPIINRIQHPNHQKVSWLTKEHSSNLLEGQVMK
uniref:Mitochondria-eating protein C-terminal domain-containing protein n=1 Tax=Magallana gigas TaxID=29159 RepID=K1R1C4_MAGGI